MKKAVIRITIVASLIVIFSVLGLIYFSYRNDDTYVYLDTTKSIEDAFSQIDEDYNFDEANANKIDITQGETVKINEGGTYLITGETDDGNIIVDVSDNEDVIIVLRNVNIKCTQYSPIYINNSKYTKIILEGENYLEDSQNYVMNNNYEDLPDATIYSKDDLTINGTGKLTIVSKYNDSIKSNDKLKILNSFIEINSVDDGIVGKDLLAIKNANINITSNGDGIKSTNDTDLEKGNIVILNSNINIVSSKDGMQSENQLVIENGAYNVKSGGGSTQVKVSEDKVFENREFIKENFNPDEMINKENFKPVDQNISTENIESTKGIKATNSISINKGEYNIDSLDDALHSNCNIDLIDTKIVINTNNDGIHADLVVNIDNSNIDIQKSYEGIEGANINILSGNINVLSSDDGINIAENNETDSNIKDFRKTDFEVTDGFLVIKGGNVNIDASGDGIDSNGSVNMTGGKVIINGPINSANAAIDYSGDFEISGGTLIAMGSSSMLQTFSEKSSQYSIVIYETFNKDSKIQLKNDEKNIIEYSMIKSVDSIIISTEDIKQNGTYYLYIDDELKETINVAEKVTRVGQSTNKGSMHQMPQNMDKPMERPNQEMMREPKDMNNIEKRESTIDTTSGDV